MWLDQTKLRLGENWWSGILRGISDSDVVILVVSPAWLKADACRAERDWAAATSRHVLVVMTGQASPGILPADLVPLQAGAITDTGLISDAIDSAQPHPLPDPMPDPPPMPLGWQMIETAVRTHERLDADIQSSVVGFLVKKERSADPKQQRLARRLADECLKRADLTQSSRDILLVTFGRGRAARFPVIGALLGGLALTHLLWVTGTYEYMDSLLDQLIGFVRGTARGVLAVNFVLGLIGVVLCGIAVRQRVSASKVALALCLITVLGVVLDSLFKVKWPIAW